VSFTDAYLGLLDQGSATHQRFGYVLYRWGLSLVLAVLCAHFALPAASPAMARAAGPLTGLPAGFVDEAVVTGLWSPRAFVFTPDGRILFAERGSATSTDINFASIRVLKNGVLLPIRAYSFNVCGDGERGFLGLALDPQFSSNGYLYIYYTRPGASNPCGYDSYSNSQDGPRNRIARLTLVGDVVSGSEKVLVDNIASDTGIHNGGDLHFGADGYLYASVGNSNLETPLAPSTQPMSQDLTRLGGKILRILPTISNTDGYVTTGNPFDSAPGAWKCGPLAHPPPPLPGSGTGPCKEILAYGFRNPFRFTIQPGAGLTTSIPFVGDVGGGAWEEVDQVSPGGNYGWPSREGPCGAGVLCQPPYQIVPGYINPVYAYSHTLLGGGAAIIAGDFYTGTVTSYPQKYWNNFFFADFVNGWIRRIAFDPTSHTWSAPEPYFATGAAGIIGLRLGPDGSLYYLSFPTDTSPASALRRIRYQGGGNAMPVAQISVSPTGGAPGQAFTFSGLGSYDPASNLPLIYHWGFGDGNVATGAGLATLTHAYAAGPPSVVSATLLVINHLGISSLPVTATLYPNDPPPTATIWLTNTTDPYRSLYYAGDVWAFGTNDARNGSGHPIPPGNLSWDVRFQHQDHWHPFLSGILGTHGQFTPSASIETDPVQWYRTLLTMRDALGQVATTYRDVLPATTLVTLSTNPMGGLLTFVGWGTNAGPWSVTRVVNMEVGISVVSPQMIAGRNDTFVAWSNCGSQSQTIVVPMGGAVYTAQLMPAGARAFATVHSANPATSLVATKANLLLHCQLFLPFFGQ